MSLNFKLLDFDGEQFLTVYVSGGAPLLASRETHGNFDQLVDLARNGDESVVDLFETGKAIAAAFNNIVEGRVAIRNGEVFYDDDLMDNSITKYILRLHDEGEDLAPAVHFMDNVMANPQVESREQFFRWIDNHDFPIDADGNIVAFKGVRKDGNGGFTSISSGTAFVNGVEHTGYIPNAVGDVVTMPRSEVEFNPRVACHKGLHAGTWKYAKDFSQGAVMHVRINPRDVVSVPNDSSSQKVRVCRYEVISFAEDNYSKARWVDKAAEATVEDAKPLAGTRPAVVRTVPATLKNVKKGSKVRRAAKPGDRYGVWVGEAKDMVDGADYTVTYVSAYDVGSEQGYVKLAETVSGGGAWLSQLVVVADGSAKPASVKSVDTRKNHLHQKRDAKGHFIKG